MNGTVGEAIELRPRLTVASNAERGLELRKISAPSLGDLAGSSVGGIVWLLWGADEGGAWAKRMKPRAAKAGAR